MDAATGPDAVKLLGHRERRLIVIGVLLPLFMGSIYGRTNSYAGGLIALAVVALVAAVGALAIGRKRVAGGVAA